MRVRVVPYRCYCSCISHTQLRFDLRGPYDVRHHVTLRTTRRKLAPTVIQKITGCVLTSSTILGDGAGAGGLGPGVGVGAGAGLHPILELWDHHSHGCQVSTAVATLGRCVRDEISKVYHPCLTLPFSSSKTHLC